MSYEQRRRFLWILFLVGLVLLAVVANATTLERMPFEELAKQATAVARLRCLGAESRWENGEIWTETRFEVVEQNKGQLPNVVTVRMLGGSVGALHSRIDGVPAFYPGEEAYAFLWKHEGEPFRILGWSQGTFRIAKDARTGLETVTQDSAIAPIFDPQTRQFRHGGVRRLPVAIFQLKLRKALQQETGNTMKRISLGRSETSRRSRSDFNTEVTEGAEGITTHQHYGMILGELR